MISVASSTLCIRIVGLDVDGTLTDGGCLPRRVDGLGHDAAPEFKRYDIQDGLGITFLRAVGHPSGHRHRPRLRTAFACAPRNSGSTASRRILTR